MRSDKISKNIISLCLCFAVWKETCGCWLTSRSLSILCLWLIYMITRNKNNSRNTSITKRLPFADALWRKLNELLFRPRPLYVFKSDFPSPRSSLWWKVLDFSFLPFWLMKFFSLSAWGIGVCAANKRYWMHVLVVLLSSKFILISRLNHISHVRWLLWN